MNRVNGLVPVVSRMVSKRLSLVTFRAGLARVGSLLPWGSKKGWPRGHIDVSSVRIPLAGGVHEEILNIFNSPRAQRSFMMQWINMALETLKVVMPTTQVESECYEILKPIESQLKQIKARHLIPMDVPDSNQDKTACLTLSITLGTPEETLDFFFRFWEFAILSKTGVRIHWTFDRSKLQTNVKRFEPYKASWVMVDHFAGIFPEGKSIYINQFRSRWRTPSFAGLWSIGFGWIGWIANCGKKVGDTILPHPVLPRFYVVEKGQGEEGSRIGYLHLRPDFCPQAGASRVLATLFYDGYHTPRKNEICGPNCSGFNGPSGIVTGGRRR